MGTFAVRYRPGAAAQGRRRVPAVVRAAAPAPAFALVYYVVSYMADYRIPLETP